MKIFRIEVTNHSGEGETRITAAAHRLGIHSLQSCYRTQLFFLTNSSAESPTPEQIESLCALLLVDPVTESARVTSLPHTRSDEKSSQFALNSAEHIVEVALRPGVTDVAARVLERGAAELGIRSLEAATATQYRLTGGLSEEELHRVARGLLCNDTIERYSLGAVEPVFGHSSDARNIVDRVSLTGLNEEALLECSRKRMLSLDAEEMREIQSFYDELGRDPTDVELETLAQTWSEHCVHKTFKSIIAFTRQDSRNQALPVEEIKGLLQTYIQAATERVNRPWVRSAFVDDAGIIEFDDHFDLAFKVETHNHPSALEPFGGANTGIGGVVRDIIAVSARPIACTDVLCFGPQDLPPDELPAGVLHPARVRDGVVAGIGDYGNKLGLPTVNGAVIYDEGYIGNPLVYCGAVGLLPKGSHPTEPKQGDRIVVLGGRTGRDGIHGATFSSAELTQATHTESGSAVQIGDPITEKGLIELVEGARDKRLYNAITDCGAGGLSSAVGEMGEELGVEMELQNVPLKYPGLTPWEIWLSEAQERMVLAVPPSNLPLLRELADLWDVEMRDLGQFSGDGWLRVRYGGLAVAELPMSFLHGGLPIPRRTANFNERTVDRSTPPFTGRDLPPTKAKEILLRMLSHPTVASKEGIVRTYDHEVRGGTLVRPFVGPHMDGPADAAVLKPLGTWGHQRAFTLSAGINPLLGKRDCYAMAVSAVDEAFRNAVSVGADPDSVALLDNFCWGNPTIPDRLGALVRACQGCYDAAVSYNAPFISGKDSLYNEFEGQPIPGTLLISAVGIVPDMRRVCTSDLKQSGNLIYLLGETREEFGGSLLSHLFKWEGGEPPAMPNEPLDRYRALHAAMRSGLIQSCHDLSEGGLAVALAEMCIGGRLGAAVDISAVSGGDFTHPFAPLFAESNGRLLLEVARRDVKDFEERFTGLPIAPLGAVTQTEQLEVMESGQRLFALSLEEIATSWQGAEYE